MRVSRPRLFLSDKRVFIAAPSLRPPESQDGAVPRCVVRRPGPSRRTELSAHPCRQPAGHPRFQQQGVFPARSVLGTYLRSRHGRSGSAHRARPHLPRSRQFRRRRRDGRVDHLRLADVRRSAGPATRTWRQGCCAGHTCGRRSSPLAKSAHSPTRTGIAGRLGRATCSAARRQALSAATVTAGFARRRVAPRPGGPTVGVGATRSLRVTRRPAQPGQPRGDPLRPMAYAEASRPLGGAPPLIRVAHGSRWAGFNSRIDHLDRDRHRDHRRRGMGPARGGSRVGSGRRQLSRIATATTDARRPPDGSARTLGALTTFLTGGGCLAGLSPGSAVNIAGLPVVHLRNIPPTRQGSIMMKQDRQSEHVRWRRTAAAATGVY